MFTVISLKFYSVGKCHGCLLSFHTSFVSTFERIFKSIRFDENAQRFSADRRPKRIEMFSNENSVWTRHTLNKGD